MEKSKILRYPKRLGRAFVKQCLSIYNRVRLANRFSETPIIIGGCGRSGTTLLSSMLSAHPQIFAITNETHAFCGTRKTGKRNKFNLSNLYANFFFEKIPQPCKRWCEKTPSNILYFQELLDYFDNRVKLINIVRDGRDVVLSEHPSKPGEYWVAPERWVNDVSASLPFENNSNVYTVRYEDLISEYEQTMRKLCQFLGIEYTESLADWYKHTKIVNHKAWHNGITKLFYRKRIC